MKKILVPIDFSEQANNALDAAVQVARRTHAGIMILNLIELPGHSNFSSGSEFSGYGLIRDYFDQLEVNTTKHLETLAAKPEFKGIKITYKVQTGSAYTSIAEHVTRYHADLVVIGSKGASGIEELLIGSNAERVIRFARCPVLTIKEKIDIDKIKDIVYALDLNNEQGHVVKAVKGLQGMLDAKLHLVKIITPSNWLADRHVSKNIKGFAEKYQIMDYTINVINDLTEEDGIIFFAEEIDAGLIAMATHSRTGIKHLISGSVAENVANHAKRAI